MRLEFNVGFGAELGPDADVGCRTSKAPQAGCRHSMRTFQAVAVRPKQSLDEASVVLLRGP